MTETTKTTLSRRHALQIGAGAAAASAIGAPAALAASKTVKIGFVSPKTGPLAPFGEADRFVIDKVREALKGGVKSGGKTYTIEIIEKDSQSNPNRAAAVAADLILKDEVHLMLVGSTPETTNPVGDQCEANDVPCISSLAPWQPWFFTRGGKPGQGFKWTYHFFWGLEDVIAVFTNMWSKVATNKSVGALFPNDGDGNAWGDKKLGFPPVLAKKGYTLTDPGRYQNLNDNFSNYISAFKKAKAEIVTGVMIPPDFITFWNQAQQQGFKPKAVSVGKALLYPVVIESMGKNAHNLSSEVWWTPTHPFKSSITGESAGAFARSYTAGTGKQWTQVIGFVHALFEVAVDVVKRSADPTDNEANLKALAATKASTIVGPVDWTRPGPFKNVSKTPLVGGQWRYVNQKFKYDLVITANETAPIIPAGGNMEPIS